MRNVLFILLTLLVSCHPARLSDSFTSASRQTNRAMQRLNYLQEKHPTLFANDTLVRLKNIVVKDTIFLNQTLIDTVIERVKTDTDTIKIKSEGVTSWIYVSNTDTITRYMIKTELDSFIFYHNDTIPVKEYVYINDIRYKRDFYIKLVFFFLLLLLIYLPYKFRKTLLSIMRMNK